MQPKPLSILIVEDSAAIARNIADYFEARGHQLDFAGDGEAGLALALEGHFDVVILDLMMPKMDGLTVCRKLREKSTRHVPVIMLTARDSMDDKLEGFSTGADDYLTKPFALEELEVRCIALSRRHLLSTNHCLEIGDLTIDRKTRQISRAGQTIELSSVGYRIVEVLAEAYPQVVSRSELIHKIWGDEPTESDALRSHIYQLRKVLDKPFDWPMLKTVHGVGFALKGDES